MWRMGGGSKKSGRKSWTSFLNSPKFHGTQGCRGHRLRTTDLNRRNRLTLPFIGLSTGLKKNNNGFSDENLFCIWKVNLESILASFFLCKTNIFLPFRFYTWQGNNCTVKTAYCDHLLLLSCNHISFVPFTKNY
jgi:hypothetical protein